MRRAGGIVALTGIAVAIALATLGGQARQGGDKFAGLLARNQELKRLLWASSLAAVAPSRDDEIGRAHV